jgi:hypothetical protein
MGLARRQGLRLLYERRCYLPMRIKMPAASAKIPIMMVGMVMWNSRVIPARIR